MAIKSFSLLVHLFLLLLCVASVSRAAVGPAGYWKSKLPNTAMPVALSELLLRGTLYEKAAAVIGKDVDTEERKSEHGKTVHIPSGFLNRYRDAKVVVIKFKYGKAVAESQLSQLRDVSLFFLRKDLRPGSTMRLHFVRTAPGAAFLPRALAKELPFSSKKLPEIPRSLLNIRPGSPEAMQVEDTIRDCEEPASPGESRYCATSLESMVDLSTAQLGTRDVLALSTEIGKAQTPMQRYTIAPSGVVKVAGSEAAACHAQTFPYAVFYCHRTKNTEVYRVSLAGEDGTKVSAVAVCHTDTSTWNPKHMAFLLLNVKPGTLPVCHFLPQDHVVWVPRR